MEKALSIEREVKILSRPKRNWYPGAMYHVMSRGNRRLTLYREVEDYLLFLEEIGRTKKLYPFKIHSLCLMTNHFHMVIETSEMELWKIMQRILHPYAMNFNRKYHYTGHLFEHRYTACLMEDERYFLEVSRYIHLNPVRAQMVREPLDYEFSSYGLFTGSEGAKSRMCHKKSRALIEDLVDTSRVLGFFCNNPREQYKEFVEDGISHEEHEMLIQKDMKEDDLWLPLC